MSPLNDSIKDAILKDYTLENQRLDNFRHEVFGILEKLLKNDHIGVHQIISRTKEFDSLNKKIDRKQGKYKKLFDITDLVGIRIISYLESDVDTIAACIEKEFKIDRTNTIDKRHLRIDQFGYKSLHLIASVKESSEYYNLYKNIRFEIQIRSILQHAWAEIEHDLGYKGKVSIPEQYRRDFNRLSALLETADKEFDRLKQDLSAYENQITNLIKDKPHEVSINQASINSVLRSNLVLIKIKNDIKRIKNASFYTVKNFKMLIEKFEFFNINTIKELEDSLAINEDEFTKFVLAVLPEQKVNQYSSAVPLFFYQQYLAAKTEDPKYVQQYFDYGGTKIDNSHDNASRFVNCYQKIKNN
jgi:putative GTP pyrophosphokinase